VLEVGCNVGAFLDYCRLAWSATVVGLEPSAYGLAGRQILDLSIHHSVMADAEQLRGRRFDLVLATEVLEHVEHPIQFLREMRGFMAATGVCVITTPRAGALSPNTAAGELYAALSTGAHRFEIAEPSRLAWRDLACRARDRLPDPVRRAILTALRRTRER
jgi:2-polyprenyl-3-methyl-5-hydroxy-6-metoxy-1,4-benzoquinol methylase